jgi:hypothetical protein
LNRAGLFLFLGHHGRTIDGNGCRVYSAEIMDNKPQPQESFTLSRQVIAELLLSSVDFGRSHPRNGMDRLTDRDLVELYLGLFDSACEHYGNTDLAAVIYVTMKLPPALQSTAAYSRTEFKKSGDKWVGKRVNYMPVKDRTAVKWCRSEADAEIDKLSETRIEGKATAWNSMNVKKCEPEHPEVRPFVWIPK